MSTTVAPSDPRLFLSEEQKNKILQETLKSSGLADDVPFSTGCIICYFLGLAVMKVFAAAICIFNPDIHEVSTPLAWLIAILYLASIPNIWPITLWFFREHITIGRYQFRHVVKSYRFWIFLLDQFLFGIPGFFLLASIPLSSSFLALLVLVPLNFVIFLFTVFFNTQFEADEDNPWAIVSTKEETNCPDNQLSIRVSDGNIIILQNMSSKLVPEPQKKTKKGNGETSEAVSEDAIQLRGYRSFGNHRAKKIKTEVFIDGNKKPCVMRADIYEIRHGRNRVDEQTMTTTAI